MSDLIERVDRVARFVEEHLEDDFQLTELSSVACYSHYHFLRMFVSLTGQTAGSYIRRRRLTKAAESLLVSNEKIIDLAFQAGFESQAAFSRAFKAMFLCTPALFRRQRSPSPFKGQPILSAAYLKHLKKGAVTMIPKIIHLDQFTVIGLGQDTEPEKNIAALWDTFLVEKHKILNAKGHESYGICYAAQNTLKKSEHIHYTAALAVNDGEIVPEGMEKIIIPAGDYAVFTHHGSIADLPKTNSYIWNTWVLQSGYQLADSPDFEVYDARFSPDSLDSAFDIYVPIKKKD